MHDFLNTLLFLTLGGSVMTVLVLLIQLIFRKKLPRTFCYCAWLLVLLRFALPVPGIFRVSPETAQAVRTPPGAAILYSGPPGAPRKIRSFHACGKRSGRRHPRDSFRNGSGCPDGNDTYSFRGCP